MITSTAAERLTSGSNVRRQPSATKLDPESFIVRVWEARSLPLASSSNPLLGLVVPSGSAHVP